MSRSFSSMVPGLGHLTSRPSPPCSNEVLQRSPGLGDTGKVVWQLALCLLLSWLIVGAALFKGIKSSGKVSLPNLFRRSCGVWHPVLDNTTASVALSKVSAGPTGLAQIHVRIAIHDVVTPSLQSGLRDE